MKSFSLLLCTTCLLPCVASTAPLELWDDKEATYWTDAYPVGNGRLGAMIYGAPQQEHIQFNEETLWTGAPHQYSNPEAHLYLKQIQDLLFAGKQGEAEKLAAAHFMSQPLNQKSYQPFGDVYISFPGHENVSHYRRELSLNDALHKVSYQHDGATYTREVFASKPDEVIVIHLNCDKKEGLEFSYWMDSIHEMKASSIDQNRVSLRVDVGADKTKNALHGKAKLDIQHDGELSVADGKITVKNANKATLYLSAATNFVNYKDVSGKPEALAAKALEQIKDKSYTEIKEAHLADFRPLFNRFSLDLGQSEKDKLPTDDRLSQFSDAQGDPALIALYAQFGRYLLLSSSREGTYPANLQGIWNDQLRPAWDSKYTTNINCEMNYWLAESTNLSECHDALFAMIDELTQTGAITAKDHYNATGWCHHHNTDIWRGSAPINASNHGIFLGGGGWLATHFWEHYLFTLDEDFLRNRAYPVLKGAAQFYLDVLIKDPKTGFLISSPSNSPENGGLVAGPTMDHQIIRAVFEACMESSRILSLDQEFAATLQEKIRQIAPNQIGKHQQMQEWLEDKDDVNNKHRHVSHLWGVYPGKDVNWQQCPEMMQAAKQSLIYRGDEGTGWSMAWKVNFWARFLDGNRAYKLLSLVFRNVSLTMTDTNQVGWGGGSYNNMFCAHPPFQIDGNFGATAGIIEMLVQSHMGSIDLLPALPDALPEGQVRGLCARGGFELSFSWADGQLQEVSVLSKQGGSCLLTYKGKEILINTEKGKSYELKLDGTAAFTPAA